MRICSFCLVHIVQNFISLILERRTLCLLSNLKRKQFVDHPLKNWHVPVICPPLLQHKFILQPVNTGVHVGVCIPNKGTTGSHVCGCDRLKEGEVTSDWPE